MRRTREIAAFNARWPRENVEQEKKARCHGSAVPGRRWRDARHLEQARPRRYMFLFLPSRRFARSWARGDRAEPQGRSEEPSSTGKAYVDTGRAKGKVVMKVR